MCYYDDHVTPLYKQQIVLSDSVQLNLFIIKPYVLHTFWSGHCLLYSSWIMSEFNEFKCSIIIIMQRWALTLKTQQQVYYTAVPLRPNARIQYTVTHHVFYFSTVYVHLRHYQLCLLQTCKDGCCEYVSSIARRREREFSSVFNCFLGVHFRCLRIVNFLSCNNVGNHLLYINHITVQVFTYIYGLGPYFNDLSAWSKVHGTSALRVCPIHFFTSLFTGKMV